MDTYGHKGGRVDSYNQEGCVQKLENIIGENGHIWTQRRDRKKRKRERESIGPSSDRAKRGEMNVTGRDELIGPGFGSIC